MSKKYMYLFGAALLALSGVGASAQSAQAKSARHVRRTNVTRNYQNYFVNAPLSISSQARNIQGNATPGIHVMLQNGRKTVDSTYANHKTGRYTLTVPRRYRAGTSLRVLAKKGYQHPFRDVIIKTPSNQKAAVKANQKTSRKTNKKSTKRAKVARKGRKANKRNVKRSAKKANRRNAKKVNKHNVKKTTKRTNKKARKAVRKSNRKPAARKSAKLAQTPTGTWTASQTKNYNQRVNFSQARGLNISKYTKQGRFVKKIVTNAPYHVDSIKPNFWKISYKPSNARKSHVFYMHLLTRNNFEVTNRSGRKANLDFLRA